MLSATNRAAAVYASVSQQPGFSALTDAEKQTVQAQLRAFYSADTAYLVANTQVNPGSLANNSGQPVSVVPQTGLGSTTSAQVVIGTGNIT